MFPHYSKRKRKLITLIEMKRKVGNDDGSKIGTRRRQTERRQTEGLMLMGWCQTESEGFKILSAFAFNNRFSLEEIS